MAEIEDDKQAQLQSAYDLMNSLYSDKDHGLAFKKMMKAKRPEANIPELDIIDTVTKPYDERMTALAEENKKLQTQMSEFLSKQQQRDDEHQVQLTLAQVQEKYKLTDDGMEKVVARMKEKNNPDAEAAAAFIVSQQPAPPPQKTGTNYFPGNLDLYGTSNADAQFEGLHKDPVKWFETEVASILNENAA